MAEEKGWSSYFDMNEIPEFIEAAIEDCVSKLSEAHRNDAKSALESSWKLGGLMIENRNLHHYVASWKLSISNRMWIATVYVATEISRVTCPAFRSELVSP